MRTTSDISYVLLADFPQTTASALRSPHDPGLLLVWVSHDLILLAASCDGSKQASHLQVHPMCKHMSLSCKTRFKLEHALVVRLC